MICYLAGPIDAVDSSVARDWRYIAAERLALCGHITFSPAHAFQVPALVEDRESLEAIAQYVIDVNDYALDRADVVLAYCGGQSHGTGIECYSAWLSSKPVFCFGGAPASVYRIRYQCWEPDMAAAVDKLIEYAG